MSALAVAATKAPHAIKKPNGQTLIEKFETRKSNELVIAFAGPIGCGISDVINETEGLLRDRGYVDVVKVKLSEFIQTALDDKTVEIEPITGISKEATQRYLRYRRLQDGGKCLRQRTDNRAILAEYAVQKIVLDRRARTAGEEQADVIVPKKIAYLIDQVKRPEEVALLRAVYRNLFYVVGVTRIYEHRATALKSEGLRSEEISFLTEIDRFEDKQHGQQLDKTLHLSDYFIRNDAVTLEERQRKIKRVLALLHGDQSITPTDSEQGMYAAYAASLRSACLSRQVGAAIAGPSGEIIATGSNDVPKYGGGLYSTSSEPNDMRCVHYQGVCFNDLHKRQLQEEIGNQVEGYLGTLVRDGKPITLAAGEKQSLLDLIYDQTRLGALIEFSRSVHAEMDAIVTMARGGGGVKGSTLYTTTFPCHSCARHIVAAGIEKVFYIEPYEKSMAKELHADAIAFEVEDGDAVGKPGKVKFLHFEGVSPRQFQSFFRAIGRKGNDGKFVRIHPRDADKAVPEYLDDYQAFEAKAVEHLKQELDSLKG